MNIQVTQNYFKILGLNTNMPNMYEISTGSIYNMLKSHTKLSKFFTSDIQKAIFNIYENYVLVMTVRVPQQH